MTNRLLFIVSAVVLTLACLHSTAQATPLFSRTSSTGSTPAMRVGKWKLQLPRKQRPVSVLVLLASSFCCGSGTCAAEEKPNVVLLFINDWAWNGTPTPIRDGMENSWMPVLQMPNVERRARECMKLTNAYASPQCSPSRVCIQTGPSLPRSGFTVYMNDRGQDYFDEKGYPRSPVVPCISDMTIDEDAVTIPEALKPLGFVSAHIGKWHMRGNPGGAGYVVHDGDTNNNLGNTL